MHVAVGTRERRRGGAKRTARGERMQRTRDALLDAGERLIAAHGLDLPSLDAICDAAGFTRGAFYVHFRSREDFLDAVMKRAGARVLDSLLGSGGEPLDVGVAAQRFVQAVDSGEYPLTKKGGLRPHQLLEACARSPAIRRRYVALVVESIDRLEAALDRGRRDRTVRRDADPRALAAILLATVVGAQTLLELEVPIDLQRAAITVLQLVSPVARR
jgi:AcrR family transcriptional regulator